MFNINIIELLLTRSGFYRVHYDARNWGLLVSALHHGPALAQLHVMNRAQLLDDAHALSRAQYLPYETALEATAYLSSETQYLPWAVALAANVFLYDRLSNETNSRGLSEVKSSLSSNKSEIMITTPSN